MLEVYPPTTEAVKHLKNALSRASCLVNPFWATIGNMVVQHSVRSEIRPVDVENVHSDIKNIMILIFRGIKTYLCIF